MVNVRQPLRAEARSGEAHSQQPVRIRRVGRQAVMRVTTFCIFVREFTRILADAGRRLPSFQLL